MFYRQASTGQVPGLRLAAGDPASAEYLAEKIAQIESGEPPAGTLAETELRLRLYHGPARFDLIVKDYQGEHVTLGSDEPIQAFFADCDAVLLCLDPEGLGQPGRAAATAAGGRGPARALHRPLRRRHHRPARRPAPDEVRPRARPGAGDRDGDDDPAGWGVERLVEAQYGMTRHALARHAPDGAIFAVSSYGRGANDGRPPAELHPLGLEGPLGWLAEQLEDGDREQLEWLWDLAPDDLPRLARCVAAFERRYPALGPRGRVPRTARSAAAPSRPAGSRCRGRGGRGRSSRRLAGYDAWGYPRRPGLRARQPRAGRRAALGRAARLAPDARRCSGRRERQAGPAQAGRVDGQGGRGPGRQRHRRARPAATGSSASRTRPPSSVLAIRKVEQAAGPGPARRALERGQGRGPRPGRRAREAPRRASSRSSASSPRPRTATRPWRSLGTLKAQAAAQRSPLERQVRRRPRSAPRACPTPTSAT